MASRFIGLALRVRSPHEAAESLERLRREHHDATHVAFAWKIGAEPGVGVRVSDDGEPAGTAGKPILAAIESSGLTEVLAAVVRHFGGTKLGTGGLARAYRRAAEAALDAAGSETVYDTVSVEVRVPHAKTGMARRLIDPPSVRLCAERYEPEPVLELDVRRGRLEALRAALEQARLKYQIED